MASIAGQEVETAEGKYKLMFESKNGWWCKRWLTNAGIWSKSPGGPGWSDGCRLIPHKVIDRVLTAAAR